MARPKREKPLTEPLESVTVFFGMLMIFGVLAAAALYLFQMFQPNWHGGPASLCLSLPGTQVADSGWRPPPDFTARPGSAISVSGAVVACVNHPGARQWLLYSLVLIPSVIVWVGALFLLWRMIRTARLAGPFAPRVAMAMWRLGWFILGGSIIASVIHALALGALIVQMINAPSPLAGVIYGMVRGVFPVPLLAGAALLTLARFNRLGAAMDDEIKATV
jgi:hypothetical protein